MYKIAEFNTLWEIAFALSAIFVYFELVPFFTKYIESIDIIGIDKIDKIFQKEDARYIKTYRWKSVVFRYIDWINRLKLFSVINSFLSLILIIIGGYNPNAEFSLFVSLFLIILLFSPLLFVMFYILFYLPRFKVKCIEEGIKNIICKHEQNETMCKEVRYQYLLVIEYIKMMNFAFAMKRDKNIPVKEVLSI